ncbi:TPA: hypothetical protein ACYQPA_004798, partial [Escherichia coli]
MHPTQRKLMKRIILFLSLQFPIGFAPIFPDTCYHLTHY